MPMTRTVLILSIFVSVTLSACGDGDTPCCANPNFLNESACVAAGHSWSCSAPAADCGGGDCWCDPIGSTPLCLQDYETRCFGQISYNCDESPNCVPLAECPEGTVCTDLYDAQNDFYQTECQ